MGAFDYEAIGVADSAAAGVAEESWHEVMDEEELWIGDMVGVEVQKEKLLLVNVKGSVHAYEDKCPHKGTPLSDGEFENGVIICPTHLWEFCAVTACGINPADSQLKPFPVRLADGKIFIALKQVNNS